MIWKFTTRRGEGRLGLLGAALRGKADPGTTSFIPRPDWYFYFLFYLLRIFKWPESVILGTVGIPTILLILLFALPFIDLRRERRLIRRPVAIVAALLTAVAMGVLTYKGATARESLGSEAVAAAVPAWVEHQNVARGGRAGRGALRARRLPPVPRLPRLGLGERRRPDLSAAGQAEAPTSCVATSPTRRSSGTTMPRYERLGEENSPRSRPSSTRRTPERMHVFLGITGASGAP